MIRRSETVFRLAARHPAIARWAVGAWARRYEGAPRLEHWLCRELRTRLQLRVRRQVRLSTGDYLYVDPFEYVGGHIAREGCYEPDTVAVFQRYLRPGMVAVDVGANVGQYTIIASGLVGPSGHVYAFEPEPANYASLITNVRLNRRTNVVCTQAALAALSGSAFLHLADAGRNGGAHSLAPTHQSTTSVVNVTTQTLDEYVYATRASRLDLLKIDVEGAELLVLQGARRVLDQLRPALVVEFASQNAAAFGYRVADLDDFLRANDYAVFQVGAFPMRPYVASTPQLDTLNVFAVPRSLLKQIAAQGMVDCSFERRRPCSQRSAASFNA